MIPLGCKPDQKDPRDRRHAIRFGSSPLPPRAEVTHRPPIRDQGQRQSCTGHALAWMLESVFASRGFAYTGPLSASFAWFHARKTEGVEREDTGVSLRSVFKVAGQIGVCPADRWTDDHAPDSEPGALAAAYASALTIPYYERCEDLQSIRHAIASENQPVVIGTTIFEHWGRAPASTEGVIPYDPQGRLLGGHAMAVCGYDDERAAFLLANSWGGGWGRGGYLWLPYEHLDREWFDAWTVGLSAVRDA